MVVGAQLIHRQILFLNGFQVPVSAIHFHHAAVLHAAKFAHSHGVGTGIVSHKADAVHFVEQGICVMRHLIFQFLSVEGDHLIEVDLLAARQDANLAAIFGVLWACQNGSAQLCALCKVLLIVHGMAEAQPGIAGNGQASQGFQQADWPIPPLILQILALQLPVSRQRDGKFRPLQLVFGQLLRHIHPMSAHTHGDQGVVVPLLGGRHHADVHMDVGGRKLMEHILELAEILLDVLLDGIHFFLSIDLWNTGFFVFRPFAVRVILIAVIRAAVCRFPGDFQSHLLLRQSDARAAGDGVLIICCKANGLPILKFHIILQYIGHKACKKISQIARLSIGAQYLHLIFSKHIHAVGVAIHAILVSPQTEPDPVEDGQLVILHHIGKALIETRFEHHTAGVNTGSVFLAAASSYHLSEQLAFFQQIFFFAQHRHHDVGIVLFGNFYGIWPHIVVFRVALGLAAGDGIGGQADGGQHIAYFKHQRVVVLLLAGVVFIHSDVPLFLHVPDELLFIPFCFGQQHKAGEDACVVTLVLGLCLDPLCDLLLAFLDHSGSVFIFRIKLRPALCVGNGFFFLTV